MTSEHLLIPLDGSALAAAVLRLAGVLATVVGAEVTLLRVVAVGTPPSDQRTAAETLREAAQPLRAAGCVVHTTVRLGEPAAAILQLAEESQVDVIVMSTHSRAGLDRAVLGSV